MAGSSNYQLKIGVATDRASFEQLQKSLQSIIAMAKQPGNELNKELQAAAVNAKAVAQAMSSSYNTKLGTLNIAKMNQELQKSNISVQTLYNSFSRVGPHGANAFNTLAAASMRANVQIKQSSKLLDSLATTMTNTVKWGITSGIWNAITTQISGAVTYVKKLDRSLNDIRIVTNKNAEAMANFAKQANNAAKAMGTGTTSYTDAALIYYQQGLADAEVKARTEVTLKAANVTRQSAEQVSEQLTAVWNGYKVSASEAESYIDKLAAVASTTAADLEELSTGMSKVASAANSMGVDIDQLNAQLATIVSVTRQAPESVGTALKTIYARMGDLQLNGEDEFGVSLGQVTSDLASVGIGVLDQSGNLRDMGDVIEEVAKKWELWNDAQKTAVAISIAGKRQYNNLIALFDNWDMYSEALDTSKNSLGTLQKQQDIYLQSTDAKLSKMRASWEKVYSTTIDTDALNTGIELIGSLAEAFNALAGAFGGGMKTINAAIVILTSVFSGQIAKGLANRARNKDAEKANASTLNLTNQFRVVGLRHTDKMTGRQGQMAQMLEAQAENNIEWVEKYDKYKKALTPEQYNKVQEAARKRAEVGYKFDQAKFEEEERHDKRIADIEANKTENDKQIENVEKEKSKLEKKIQKLQQEKEALEQSKNGNKTKRRKNINLKDQELETAKQQLEQQQALLEQKIETQEDYNQLLEEENALHKETKDYLVQEANAEENDIQQALDQEIGTEEQLERDTLRTNRLNAMAGAAQVLAGSVMAVSSAFDIWNNQDLSFTEKLTQTLFTLGPSVLMLVNGFKKLAVTGPLTSQALNGMTAASAKHTMAEIAETAATRAANHATEESIVTRSANTNVINAESGALDNNTRAEGSNQIARNTGNKAGLLTQGKDAVVKGGKAVAGGFKKGGAALASVFGKGGSAAAAAAGGAALASIAAVAAVGLVAFVAFSKAAQAKAKKELEALQKQTEVAIKKAAESQEAASKLNNLADGFKSISEEIKENSGTIEELRSRVRELALEYENAELAAKAFAMSHEQLESTIKDQQKKANEQAIRDAEAAQKLLSQQLDAVMTKQNVDRSWWDRVVGGNWGKNAGSVEYSYAGNNTEKDFLRALNAIEGISTGTGDSGTIDFDVTKLSQDSLKQLEYVMSQYSSKLAGHNVYESMEKFIGEFEPIMTQYFEQANNIDEAIRANAIASVDQFKNVQEYLQERDALYQAIEDTFDTKEEAEAWIQNQLGAIDKDLMIEGELQLGLADQWNKDSEKLSKEIQSWTKEQQEFIYANLDFFEFNLDKANAFLEILSSYFDAAGQIAGVQFATSLLSTTSELSKEQVEELYSSNFANYAKQNQKEFSALGIEEQKNQLSTYALQEQLDIEQNKQQRLKNLREAEEQYVQSNEDIYAIGENKVKSAKQDLNDIIEKSTLSDEDKTRFTDDYFEYLAASYGDLTGQELADYEFLEERSTDDFLSTLAEGVEILEEYDNGLNMIQNAITTVENSQEKWAELLTTTTEKVKTSTDKLRNFKTAYQSINDAIKEYNTHGGLSIDSLTTLVSLGSEYLQELEITNEGLKLRAGAEERIYKAQMGQLKINLQQEAVAQIMNRLNLDALGYSEKQLAKAAKIVSSLYQQGNGWEQIQIELAKIGVVAGVTEDLFTEIITSLDLLELGFENASDAVGNFKKELLEWADEFDRYWIVNKNIDKVNHALEKLRDNRDGLTGDELRRSLEQDNALIQIQTERYNALLLTQQAEQKELQELLSEEYGVQFNENGDILNYQSATKKELDKYNENQDDEEAKKRYEDFKKDLERYNILYYEEMTETFDELEEFEKQLIDNNFEIWTSHIDELLEKQEELRDMLNFDLEINQDFTKVDKDLKAIQDNLIANFETYAVGDNSTISTLLTDIAKIENEIDAMSRGEGSNMFDSMSEAITALKEKQQALRDAALDTKQAYEDIYTNYLAAIDQAIEKAEEYYEQYERINNTLEYNAELIELIYGEKAYDLYSSLYDTQLATSTSHLSKLMEEKEMYEELYAQAEEGSQEQLKYKERLYELEDQINSKVLEHIKLIKEDYKNTVNQVYDELEKKLTGGLSLSELEEEWDRTKEKAEKYYDTVEGLYHIQTLSNNMMKEVDNVSLKNQQKLKALHDKEIAYLKDKKDLTEYDIQAAEARYQITLKEIALEEAQQNKNSMKLVRDTSGNWTYQYVADQDIIRDKTQEIADAYHNLYQLANDAYKNNADSIIDLNKNYIEAAKQIALDSTLTEEERVEKLEKLRDRYLEDYQVLIKENSLYADDVAKSYLTSLEALEKLDPESIKTSIGSVIGEDTYSLWSQDIQKLVDLWTGTGEEGTSSAQQAIEDASSKITEAIGEAYVKIDELAKLVDQKFNHSDGVVETFADLTTEVGKLDSAMDLFLTQELFSNLDTFATKVKEVSVQWNNVAAHLLTAIGRYQTWSGLASPIEKEIDIV